jgi:hypothetical protein
MAYGVYEAVRQQGLRVPTDISIVGFDDLPEARWSSPPLTTVRQPLSEMGVLAARTVLRLVRGEEIETLRFELATQLVIRESTAPPRGARGALRRRAAARTRRPKLSVTLPAADSAAGLRSSRRMPIPQVMLGATRRGSSAPRTPNRVPNPPGSHVEHQPRDARDTAARR